MSDRGLEGLAPYGRALRHYHFGGRTDAAVILRSSLGEEDRVPVSLFFRGEGLGEGPLLPWEGHALTLCRGHVLDAGAGAGSDALWLERRGLRVTAVDLLEDAVAVMRDRGVSDARQADLFRLEAGPFDTVLMMMNGFGPAGTLDGLDRLLDRLHRLVKPDGQVLADVAEAVSARAAYEASGGAGAPLPAAGSTGGEWSPSETGYPGEAWVTLQYDGPPGPPFPELYLDLPTLTRHAGQAGWQVQVAYESGEGIHVVRLVRASAERRP